MIGVAEIFDEARRLAAQEAMVPALRGILFLFGLIAAFVWWKRRPATALVLLASAGFVSLGFWLIQIDAPFGSGTDRTLTTQWAQAGVNAVAEPREGGYVWATPAERSLAATLAAFGMPPGVVFKTPQMAVLLCLVFLTLVPRTFLRNPTTAAFAGCLALGGGLWPGQGPYGAVLRRPAHLLMAIGFVLLAAAIVRARRNRGLFRPWRFELILGLMGVAVLGRAWTGGAEPGVLSSLALAGASIALASPLRAAARSLLKASPSAVRLLEAVLLLSVFAGSGLFWWNPARALPGFIEAREGGAMLRKPLEWIRTNVPKTSVVLASPAYSAQLATFTGRRVLFPPPGDPTPLSEPFRRARFAESCRKGEPIARLAEAFSVTHLFLGPGEKTPPKPETEDVKEPRLGLVLVYEDVEDFRIFRLLKK